MSNLEADISDFPSMSDPKNRDKLFKIVRDCSDSLTRIAAERDFIREQITEISKELELPKKLVNKLVKTYFKQNFAEEVVSNEQFVSLYEEIVK